MAKINEELSNLNQAEIIVPGVVTDQTIEPVVNLDFQKTIAEAAFMNEIVEVQLAATTDENQPPHIVMNVNGISQPFFRDIPVKCRRMFLEVLARCKESKYTQTRNAMEPDRSEMVQRTAHAYPFQVLHDPNPKGSAWLRAVMAERN